MRQFVNKEDQQKIILLYTEGNTIKCISLMMNIPYHWVRTILLKNGCKLKNYSYYKWNPNNDEIQEIIKLYTIEKRGIQFIANKFNTQWNNIRDFLLSKNITLWDKSTLIKSNIEHYGQSKGFSGRTHSIETKKKMSKSQFGNCNSVTGPRSRFILTTIGKVQGSYELAYLQKLLNEGLTLPSKCGKVKTVYGSYFPDFEYSDKFVEIKSSFTWDVCKGKFSNGKGIKTDVQYKKIKWTDKNIKPVEIIILDEKEALKLFLQAIKNRKLTLEEITYKNGKYYKTKDGVDIH